MIISSARGGARGGGTAAARGGKTPVGKSSSATKTAPVAGAKAAPAKSPEPEKKDDKPAGKELVIEMSVSQIYDKNYTIIVYKELILTTILHGQMKTGTLTRQDTS